jgi:AraC family transcriptional regulator
MSEQRPNAAPAAPSVPRDTDAPRPRVGLDVTLRVRAAGANRHVPSAEHVLSVHADAPARVSCHAGRVRSVRKRGHVDLMPAGMSDEWFEHDASRTVDLRLSASLVRRVAEDLGLSAERAGLRPLHHATDPQIEHVAWALEAERRGGFPNGLLYRESLGVALAVHLLGRYRAPTTEGRGLSPAQRQRVVDYIEAHLDEDLSLERLARVAGVSGSYFKALFKRSTGVPAHAYVVQRRVERARALLLRGDLPASEVALQAGFSHQSHMARCMRRVLGVSPSAITRSRG